MELDAVQLEKREKSQDNLVNLLIEHRSAKPKNTLGKAHAEIPIELKRLAVLGEGSVREKAEVLDIPFSSVSYAERGLVSEGKSDETLEALREEKSSQAKDKAVENLMLLLGKVPELIGGTTKLKEVTGAARDMAAIKKDLSGDGLGDGGARVVIYAPTLVKENHYESIPVQLKD